MKRAKSRFAPLTSFAAVACTIGEEPPKGVAHDDAERPHIGGRLSSAALAAAPAYVKRLGRDGPTGKGRWRRW